jgi:hypothetical protein
MNRYMKMLMPPSAHTTPNTALRASEDDELRPEPGVETSVGARETYRM